MASMTIRTTAAHEFTEDSLLAMPDGGNRYEVVDGSLVVTPSPLTRHQVAVGELHLVLRAACPRELQVLLAPFDVRLSRTTVLIPDLLVAARASLTEKNLPVAPLLAVEVLSPSTRHIDLGLKRSRYEAAGTAAYWVVDPAVPSIIAWELVDGVYVEAGRSEGADPIELDAPFPVRVVPEELLDL